MRGKGALLWSQVTTMVEYYKGERRESAGFVGRAGSTITRNFSRCGRRSKSAKVLISREGYTIPTHDSRQPRSCGALRSGYSWLFGQFLNIFEGLPATAGELGFNSQLIYEYDPTHDIFHVVKDKHNLAVIMSVRSCSYRFQTCVFIYLLCYISAVGLKSTDFFLFVSSQIWDAVRVMRTEWYPITTRPMFP